MRADLRQVRRQLNYLLWKSDFLGLRDHRSFKESEYECLLWPLYGILIHGGTTREITSYLESELMNHFGVPAPESTSAFADDLIAWYQTRPT